MHIHPLASRRIRAHALDCVAYAGIAAAGVPIGLLLLRLTTPSRPMTTVLSCAPPILAGLVAAAAESGPRAATWGKRRLGLEVRAASRDASVPFARSLVRNVVKIVLPWQLGHVVAIGAFYGGFENGDRTTMIATTLTYPVLGVLLAAVALGSGRGLEDRLAGTTVVDARHTDRADTPA
jgi:uncharacterized RDD family membrane protein YckC